MSLFHAIAAALAASAQIASPAPSYVIGGTAAQDCYEAARGSGAFHSDIQTCLAALEDMRLSIEDRAGTYVNLGILLRRRGATGRAIDAYDQAIALRPDLAEAWLNRGAARFAAGDREAALADLNRALELDLAEPEVALVNRAAVYEAQGDVEAAYRDLTAALEIEPGYPPALEALERYEVRTAGGGA